MMDGKTVIITGGNRGLGKETAKEMAQRGAKVILACRNLTAGKEARDEIIALTKNKNVLLKELDLSSQKSVRAFAHDVLSTESRLDVLIHNAAVLITENAISKDGLELAMATNHFGPFLLTHLLIGLLKQSSPSRIVTVSSIGHLLAWVDATNLNNPNSWFPPWNYFNTKFANICFTRELARRLEGTNVTANCLNPGFIATDIWNKVPSSLTWLFDLIFRPFLWAPSEGCKRIMYLATSEDVAEVSGKYFHNDRVTWTALGVANDANCQSIWKETQRILNFKKPDCVI